MLAQKRVLITDTTMRDAHQSLLATRMRQPRHGGHRALLRAPAAAAVLGGVLGRRHVRRRRCASCARIRGRGSSSSARPCPNLLLQMLLRSANAVGYTNYPDNVVRAFVKQAAASRRRRVPRVRLAQLGREHARRHRRRARDRQAVRSGDLLHRQPVLAQRNQVHARLLPRRWAAS